MGLQVELEPLYRGLTEPAVAMTETGEKTTTFWYDKGNSLADLGRYEDAIHCYDLALAIDWCYVVAWNNKGNSLYCLGRYEEAVRSYDQALATGPRFAYVWYNKALSEQKLGRRAEAARSYQQMDELTPLQDGEECGTGCALGVLLGLALMLLCWLLGSQGWLR